MSMQAGSLTSSPGGFGDISIYQGRPRVEEPDDPVSPEGSPFMTGGHGFDEYAAKSVLVNLLIIYPECADMIRGEVMSLMATGMDIPSIERIVRTEMEQMPSGERARRRQLWEEQSEARRDAVVNEAVQRAKDNAMQASAELQARTELQVKQVAEEAEAAVRRIHEDGAEDVQRIRSATEVVALRERESAELEVQRIRKVAERRVRQFGARADEAARLAETEGAEATEAARRREESANAEVQRAKEGTAAANARAQRLREEATAMQEESRRKIAEIEEQGRRIREGMGRSSNQEAGASEGRIGQLEEEARRRAEEVDAAARQAVAAKRREAAELERAAVQERLRTEENFAKIQREAAERRTAADRALVSARQTCSPLEVGLKTSKVGTGIQKSAGPSPEARSVEFLGGASPDVEGEWPKELEWPEDKPLPKKVDAPKKEKKRFWW